MKMLNSNREIAHIDEQGNTHPLETHLFDTAKLAHEFAKDFGSGQWAFLAALWHDLGKYSQAFQMKITSEPSMKVDHSTGGAQWAFHRYADREGIGRILAWLIAGHHSGLADYSGADGGAGSLVARLKKQVPSYPAPAELLQYDTDLGQVSITDGALWVRMLFSALVDADFLDTERFFKPESSSLRGDYPTIGELFEKLEAYMRSLNEKALDTPINRLREKIYREALEKASEPGGIYTLCVPTGGGKTLTSMAFALRHAAFHDKRRIVYLIPYTSIIEQNAAIYRSIFGDAVIEHHSQFDLDDSDERYLRQKLAAENWDAPIIVTTTVQFFESLFANRPSRCRKLHNIAHSVVVIDEVQTLPPRLLEPILRKIEALRDDYGVTFLLSTATQPDFNGFDLPEYSLRGLKIDGELTKDPSGLARKLRRVEILWRHDPPRTIERLAAEILDTPSSSICIVNTRQSARELFETIRLSGRRKSGGIYHLSANMCGAHRLDTIETIRRELQNGSESIRVVSTNLIEAGVDLDFPRLWRELAGLESIAQAAGRCNREGRLATLGVVEIFALEKTPRYLRLAVNALREILPDIDDPLSPEAFRKYFAAYYRQYGERLDSRKIQEMENRTLTWPFASVARTFQMIDDGYDSSVVIPYDERAREAIALLDVDDLIRASLRRLQRYTIQLPQALVDKLLDSGEVEEVRSGICVLRNKTLYRSDIGFDETRSGLVEPEELIL